MPHSYLTPRGQGKPPPAGKSGHGGGGAVEAVHAAAAHRAGGMPRTTEVLLARTSHAALASPAAARRWRVVLPFHARVWLRPRHESRVALLEVREPGAV